VSAGARSMQRVLVTGATGFVGRILCEALRGAGYAVRAALRTRQSLLPDGCEPVVVGEVSARTEWRGALAGVDFVVHLAAKAHAPESPVADVEAYMEINAHGTGTLAAAATAAGVRRFVYLSSIKVNGEETVGHAYTPDDIPSPADAYGLSKWLGEKHLLDAAASHTMEVVIVRSPLVYGAGVRANFRRLMQWVDHEWPLPLGAVRNTRSLVSVWNLCDLLVLLLGHPRGAGRVWMVSDAEDLATPELIRRLGRTMNRRVRLWRVSPAVLRLCGTLSGQTETLSRLCGSLAVDVTCTRRELGWSPPLSVDESLARTSVWYFAECRRGV
jgi:nucleoside-diphosphate-sugar epimerase